MKLSTLVAALLAASPLITTAQTTNDTKANQDVVRHFFESLNRGDMQAALSDLAEGTKNFGRPVGRECFRLVLEDIYGTFPDERYEIQEMIAQGDSVVVRCKVSAERAAASRYLTR